MEAFVTGLHVVLCLFLILVVLVQPGKNADFGAALGGSSQSGGSAAEGTSTIGKLTAITASLFMLTSLTLAWFSNRPEKSVITDEALQEEAGTPTPEATPEALAGDDDSAKGDDDSGDDDSGDDDSAKAAPVPAPPPSPTPAPAPAPAGG
jgi:preprotein translocase subunit SecG